METEDGGVFFPKATAAAVHKFMAAAEQLPGLAATKLALQRQRDDEQLRVVVGQFLAFAEAEYARGVRDGDGLPWTSWLLIGGAGLLCILGGIGLGVAFADGAQVVVAR